MGLDAISICAIIEACGKNGVADLKLGDMELSFFIRKGLEDRPELAGQEMPLLQMQELDPYASQASGHPGNLQSKNFVDQEMLEDIQASQRMIDDPLGFEQEMITQHLRGGME